MTAAAFASSNDAAWRADVNFILPNSRLVIFYSTKSVQVARSAECYFSSFEASLSVWSRCANSAV